MLATWRSLTAFLETNRTGTAQSVFRFEVVDLEPECRRERSHHFGVFMNLEKFFKSKATGAVGMCASRRDVHISIAQGVRVVWCGQHLVQMLSMPCGFTAGMAGGAAA